MSTEDYLALLKLLSALESWSFSVKTPLPDFLHKDLARLMDLLTVEILKEKKGLT